MGLNKDDSERGMLTEKNIAAARFAPYSADRLSIICPLRQKVYSSRVDHAMNTPSQRGNAQSMHPSSFKRHAPARPPSPQFIDFFALEQAQIALAKTRPLQTPISGLNADSLSTHLLSSPTAGNGSTSAAASDSIQQVQQYLTDQGYELPRGFLRDVTIQHRLHSADLSAETLLVALQTLDNPHHPLHVTLGISDHELSTLRNRLAGIVSNRSGFLTPIRTEVLQAGDNPERLIHNLLTYLRHLAR